MVNVFQTFSYNTQLAKTHGIKSAIYLSFIGFDRKKLFKRWDMYETTGLSDEEQREVEDCLKARNLIAVEIGEDGFICVQVNPDKIRVMTEHAEITVEENVAKTSRKKSKTDSITVDVLLEAIEGTASKSQICSKLDISMPTLDKLLTKYNITLPTVSKKSKQQKMYESMIKSVDTGDSVVDQYVVDWINSVRNKPGGYMTKESFKLSLEKLLYDFPKQEDRIEILKIAIRGSYRDINWAINRFTPSISMPTYSTIKSDGSEMVGESF